ncbi:BTB/POZ domain-containing protein [Ditylenchus destructor]|uniref:BTB/POZ domain-containing protein n=1 Tax=Ditylenchus destructor TaxID=166010 RepID=A0AAD4MKH6_9BILA|nr:BTB/POZ domain-containing protein [Ditylenchus destructor]
MHSKYFKDQFTRHKSDNRAILQNVDYDEFIELLSIIYPTGLYPSITVENVESIAKLAFKFDMASLMKQCETFLMGHSKEFGRAKSLLMAEWYGLVHLLGKIIDEIENIADVRGMKPEYDALSDRTKRMMFDKICLLGPVTDWECLCTSTVSDREDLGISNSRATEILQELASSACCPSDGVLVVENKRISIHKMYLAVYSEYFKTMFYSEFEEGNTDEIVLEEVGYSEMLELLAIIYPTEKQLSITDTNIGSILKMADRFNMASILARCKKLLQNSTQIRAARKLWYAQRYNLPDLQEEYAQKYKIISDIKKLKAEPEFELFDDKTRSLILDKIISS